MSPHPLLLGHRGASKYAEENTPAAFDLALAHGCDGFEFDVRYSSDARSVICHDPRYRRKRIDASSFSELDLPSADEVIHRYAGRAYLDIELKVPGEVQPVFDALGETGPNRFVISSFLPEVLEATHARRRDVPLGLICENSRQLKMWSRLPIRAVMVQHRLVEAKLIDELHSAGKQILVWTVNRASAMRRFAELGVDGLISNDTQLLVRTLKEK
jgi:glycerophosphoryl diester phosphodiesterase